MGLSLSLITMAGSSKGVVSKAGKVAENVSYGKAETQNHCNGCNENGP